MGTEERNAEIIFLFVGTQIHHVHGQRANGYAFLILLVKTALSSAKYILQSIARCFTMKFQQDIDHLMNVTRVVLSLMVVTLQSHKQLMSDTEVVSLYLLRATSKTIFK